MSDLVNQLTEKIVLPSHIDSAPDDVKHRFMRCCRLLLCMSDRIDTIDVISQQHVSYVSGLIDKILNDCGSPDCITPSSYEILEQIYIDTYNIDADERQIAYDRFCVLHNIDNVNSH